MEMWVQAASILALVSFSALCVYGILLLKELRGGVHLVRDIAQSSEKLPKELQEIRGVLIGTLKNIEETTSHSARIMEQLNKDLHSTDGIFAEIDALAKQLRKLREYLQTGIMKPLGNIAMTVSALSKGSEAFSEALRKPPVRTREQPPT